MQKTKRSNRSQAVSTKIEPKHRTQTAINQKPIQIPGPIPRSKDQRANRE